MITTREFWLGAAERALKTWLQTAIAVLGVQAGIAAITPSEFMALPWATAGITATIAAVLSLATSIGNADFVAGAKPLNTN